ncbi:MAG: hypothetical protein HYV02_05265 [Deltaproteobacteria bacterium]|nr:hypothetical protein [Deltaproteobacteria bacterium]
MPRIVSLIASSTEMVAALGCADQLVGISHECDYPPSILHLPLLKGLTSPPPAAKPLEPPLQRRCAAGSWGPGRQSGGCRALAKPPPRVPRA